MTTFFILVLGTYLGLNREALNGQLAFNPEDKIDSYADQKAALAEKSVAGAVTQSTTGSATSSKAFVASENRIEIPKLNVIGNLTYPNTESEVEKLLDYSIVHLPESVLPGDPGNTIFTGHSSNTFKNHYSSIFSTLNKLEDGDMILLYKGRELMVYKVYDKQIIKPKLEYLSRDGKEKLTLITCWPIGTASKRLVVYAERVR